MERAIVMSVNSQGTVRVPDYLVDPSSRTVTVKFVRKPDNTAYVELFNPQEWERDTRVLIERFRGYKRIQVERALYGNHVDVNVTGQPGNYGLTIPKHFRKHLPKGKTVLV